MDTLGKRIAKARIAKGLSQGQLAELLHWSGQSRVGNYERDQREPTLEDINRIASIVGVSAKELIFGPDANDNQTVIQVTSSNDSYVYVAMTKPRQTQKGIDLQPISLPPLAIAKDQKAGLNEHTRGLAALSAPIDDGMSPYISPGDVIVVDTSDTEPEDGGIYLIALNGKCLIRKLYTSADSIILRSFTHPDKAILEHDRSQLQIMGKVAYRAG
ncbi:LexA family transcriptional regulator [Chromobacterium vaccinii]|uniref:XRE family transcriptional regulator n=1 Tax=Chromobacterium vaccinii TaxID=1108595 RepID=UPI0031E14001